METIIKDKKTLDFLRKAYNTYGNLYDYTKVEYIHSKTKVLIICKKNNHEFMQTPNNHLQGFGCTFCSKKNKKTTQSFILEAQKFYGDKYDYSEVIYVNANTKIKIKCQNGHIFEQRPDSHLSGKGCVFCSGNNKKTTQSFILDAQKLYGDKYDYSEVNYVNNHTKIKIKCQNGHIFEQTPHNHLSGKGCNKCLFCSSCSLFRSNGKLCVFCKPKNVNKGYQKTKEWQVVKFLKDSLPDNDFIHNKSVGSECNGSALRPDIRYDVNDYFLIVEVDEHQHRGYDKICEKTRMVKIASELGLPCVFIRYNPNHKESNLNFLLTSVKHYIKNKPDFDDLTGVFVEYLFYR